MIQFFRRFLGSKLGIAVTLAFVALIAVAFATSDIANTGKFGSSGGGGTVAKVGKEQVDTSELSQAASAAVENLRQENPQMTMQAFVAGGGLERALDSVIDRTAIGDFGRAHGIVASDRLVDSEITKVPAFRGPDGRFSDATYRQAIAQRGLTEQRLREDLAQGLVARQVLVPASFGAVAPRDLALRYATLLREKRTGAIALLPSAAFAPRTPPTDAQLGAFYAANRDRFIRPERRVIRYATFGEDALKSVPAPTEAEIAARYKANAALYAPLESRRVTQLVVPTEAAAKAIVAEISGGKTLEAAASGKGLSTALLGILSKDALARQSSQAVADAAFAAPKGGIAAIARSGLGWHIVRIDAIETRAGRTLDQARGEIVAQLAVEKRRAALTDFSARIEEEFDNGGTLTDVAKELGIALQQTAPLTADGKVYMDPAQSAPTVLARVVQTAFSMERENQPQLAEVEAGKTFVVFDVSEITASAPAPLAEIRNDVAAAFLLDAGAKASRAAAEKVQLAARKGDLQAAVGSLGTPLPPVQRFTGGREQLAQMGQRVPPPLALMFSMAEGTVKILKAPGDNGWFVVRLDDIEPGAVAPNDPILAAAGRELGSLAGREYADALRRAIRAEVGVKRNEAGVKAVRNQLTGTN